ncbi:MAG: hypothetical protein VYA30_14470 [Myxococcota bacterium]|nr:hypothetical protein [Myxococcota bacterium]
MKLIIWLEKTRKSASVVLSCVLMTFIFIGCEADAPEATTAELILNVKTVDTAGQPVQSVRFFINGQKYGITFEDGFVGNVKYVAKIGETVTFDVEDPDGYRVPLSVDRSLWKVAVASANPPPVDFEVVFERPEREFVFLVKVDGGRQAVLLDGKTIGETDGSGEAILKVDGFPNQKFKATVGSVVLSGVFTDGAEVYVLSGSSVGPVGKTTSVKDAPAAPEVSVKKEPQTAVPVVKNRRSARPPKAMAQTARRVREPARQARTPRVREPVRTARERTSFVEPREPVRRERRARPVVEPKPAPVQVGGDSKPKAKPRDEAIEQLLGSSEDEDFPPRTAPPVDNRSAKVAAAPVIELPEDKPKVEAKVEPTRSAVRAQPEQNTGGLMLDDGAKVEARHASTKVSVSADENAKSAGMEKDQLKSRLDEIKAKMRSSGVMTRSDAQFLKSVSRKASRSAYYEANRLLGKWYFKLKDYRRQANALEEATRGGRYKQDPLVLLSLAKAYGRMGAYSRAVRTMRRVERKARKLSKKAKSDAYKFHAEMLEFSFLRQYNDDPKEANYNLLTRALAQWEKFRDFGYSGAGRAIANKKIQKLSKLKRELEY